MDTKPTLTVLGGGPAGYPAAFLAADLGMDVTLIEAAPALGGTCLHRGCIPSKTLLHAAREMAAARRLGAPEPPREALPEILHQHKAAAVEALASGLDRLAAARKVRRIQGRAEFDGPGRLRIGGQDDILPYERLLVAVGSEPAIPDGFPVGHPDLWTSDDALEVPCIPGRLLVVGGGAIGLELGSLYAALGARVTLIEALPAFLPVMDRDLLVPLLKRLRGTFEALLAGTVASNISPLAEGGFAVTLRPAPGRPDAEGFPKTETFDKILVAAGRRPAIAGLHPERAGLDIGSRGFLADAEDGSVRAAGDCASAPLLAHKATHEARLAAARFAADVGGPGAARALAELEAASGTVPSVVYTDPEVAVCGLGEVAAKAGGIPYAAAKCHWAGSGRALANGRTDGLTKWVYDPESLRILGAAIVGEGAGELLGEALLAIECKATLADVARTMHPHPTLSETWMEAASVPLHPLHALPRRR
jgi:dihydrolipoamide dehydrogenase